jgi:hypothetical protein
MLNLKMTRPSLFVRVVMGPMTKVLNPAIRRLAGRPHVQMAALVRHWASGSSCCSA